MQVSTGLDRFECSSTDLRQDCVSLTGTIGGSVDPRATSPFLSPPGLPPGFSDDRTTFLLDVSIIVTSFELPFLDPALFLTTELLDACRDRTAKLSPVDLNVWNPEPAGVPPNLSKIELSEFWVPGDPPALVLTKPPIPMF